MTRFDSRLLFSFAVMLIASLALFRASTARADEATNLDLIARGVELRKQGDDAEALATFERSYAQHPEPRALAQIALAHQALAHWREAERAMLSALRSPGDPWIVRQRAFLDESLRDMDAHLAWLELETNAVVGEVWIDGERCASLPLDGPIRVLAGAHVVEIRASGRPSLERAIRIEAQTRAREAFAFAPQASTLVQADSGSTEGPSSSGASARRTAGWAVLAGAGALLAGGIVANVVREEQVAIYNDDSRCFKGAAWRDEQCGSHRDAASTAQTFAIAAYAGAAAATIVSVTLLAGKSSSPTRTAAPVSCGVRGIGVLCGGAF
jgi:hypothetical protein